MRALVLAAALLGAAPAAASPRHALYGELLGKGGLVGVGYDFRAARRLTVGATASYYGVGGDRLFSLSPYLGVYPWRGAFAHLGPQLWNVTTGAAVPEWPGRSETGVAAQVSAGWEWKGPPLVRVYLMTTVGKGGVAPWGGLSLGWAF